MAATSPPSPVATQLRYARRRSSPASPRYRYLSLLVSAESNQPSRGFRADLLLFLRICQVGDWSTSIYPSILTATPCMLCGGGVSMVMDAALHDWCGPLPGGSKLPIYPQIPDGFTAEELESLLLF
uniref:Uncharacterized protein n=1 Tax=Aegilops tauschii subsp. strangulata TaxID=200361 RepID=A0A453FWW5_AEGTS